MDTIIGNVSKNENWVISYHDLVTSNKYLVENNLLSQ